MEGLVTESLGCVAIGSGPSFDGVDFDGFFSGKIADCVDVALLEVGGKCETF